MKQAIVLIVSMLLVSCAGIDLSPRGWYKPDMSQSAQDRYECMANSQMQVSQAGVNGTATPYYGQVDGAANSYTTTNTPLFSACMQAHGYVFTTQKRVNEYEATQSNTPDQCLKDHNGDTDFCK
jgi:hypothetical protein